MEKIGYLHHISFNKNNTHYDKPVKLGLNVQIIPGSVTYPDTVEYGSSFTLQYKVQNISAQTRSLFGYLYKEGYPETQICRWNAPDILPGEILYEETTVCPFNQITESWEGTLVVGWFEGDVVDMTTLIIVGVAGITVIAIGGFILFGGKGKERKKKK